MNENALQKMDPQEMERQPTAMQIIAKAAVDGKIDAQTMEALVKLAREERADLAKQAFDSAMGLFQSECPIIKRTVLGAQAKYRFAPLDHIIVQVKELLKTHGFSYTLTSECKPKSVKAIIKVTHRSAALQSGHSELSEFEVPTDDRNNLMNAAQAIGGAMTFAKRYAFCNAFGILTADDDKDGQIPELKTSNPLARKKPALQDDRKAAVTELWELLTAVRGSENNWKMAEQWLADECGIDKKVAGMTVEEIRNAISKAKASM